MRCPGARCTLRIAEESKRSVHSRAHPNIHGFGAIREGAPHQIGVIIAGYLGGNIARVPRGDAAQRIRCGERRQVCRLRRPFAMLTPAKPMMTVARISRAAIMPTASTVPLPSSGFSVGCGRSAASHCGLANGGTHAFQMKPGVTMFIRRQPSWRYPSCPQPVRSRWPAASSRLPSR